jgi:hypothetical protein
MGPLEQDLRAAAANGYRPHATLTVVLEAFQRWLYLPDTDPVLVALAGVAANRLSGDPVWLLLLGPPGGGKTEILASLTGLEDVRPAAVLSEAALLSGTPKKETATGAKGGLLRELGAYGIVTLKDFGSVLSMRHEARAPLLAALREVFDGSWTRHVGTDGGRTLHWEGKMGLIAGGTPVIDQHHAVMAALGERFALYRMSVAESDRQAMASLAHHGHEVKMRAELRAAVAGLFDTLDASDPPGLSQADRERLVAMATLVVRCRSAVIRDGYSREVELVPEAEAPGRLVGVLARLLDGARIIGATDEDAWRVVEKTALDSMPAQRLAALRLLLGGAADTTAIAAALDLPTTTTRRTLEDLTAHHLVKRHSQGKGHADTWELTEWTRDRSRNLQQLYIDTEHGKREFSGTPVFGDHREQR